MITQQSSILACLACPGLHISEGQLRGGWAMICIKQYSLHTVGSCLCNMIKKNVHNQLHVLPAESPPEQLPRRAAPVPLFLPPPASLPELKGHVELAFRHAQARKCSVMLPNSRGFPKQQQGLLLCCSSLSSKSGGKWWVQGPFFPCLVYFFPLL